MKETHEMSTQWLWNCLAHYVIHVEKQIAEIVYGSSEFVFIS